MDTQTIERPEDFGPLFVVADGPRLQRGMALVRDCALGTRWWTLKEIEAATGVPSPSVSAHLRHLTKPEWGSYQKERRKGDAPGLFLYRLRPGTETQTAHPLKTSAKLIRLRGLAKQALEDLWAGRLTTAETTLDQALRETA